MESRGQLNAGLVSCTCAADVGGRVGEARLRCYEASRRVISSRLLTPKLPSRLTPTPTSHGCRLHVGKRWNPGLRNCQPSSPMAGELQNHAIPHVCSRQFDILGCAPGLANRMQFGAMADFPRDPEAHRQFRTPPARHEAGRSRTIPATTAGERLDSATERILRPGPAN